jgi:hypothetical protein
MHFFAPVCDYAYYDLCGNYNVRGNLAGRGDTPSSMHPDPMSGNSSACRDVRYSALPHRSFYKTEFHLPVKQHNVRKNKSQRC